MVRCKFECVSVTKRKGWGGHAVLHDAEFNAVTSVPPPQPGETAMQSFKREENAEFFAATPSGKLNVGTVVPDVFEVAKFYYLDIAPAEP